MFGTVLTRLSGGIRSTDREELCMLVEQSTHAAAREEVTAQQPVDVALAGCGMFPDYRRISDRRSMLA
jgi:hypothetical protein